MLIEFGVQLNELKLDLESHIADSFQSTHTISQVKRKHWSVCLIVRLPVCCLVAEKMLHY